MRGRITLLILLVACISIVKGSAPSHKEMWLNGEVVLKKDKFFGKDQLCFLADNPVPNNSTGNLVKLGAPSSAMKTMASLFVYLTGKHMKVRFYGELTPIDSPHPKGSPDVAFIVWMAHPVGLPDTPPGGLPAPASRPSR